jgi:hypothetical protein
MATFLNAQMLAYMRAQQITMIEEIGGFVNIKRPTGTSSDGSGGFTQTFTTQTAVPARVYISSGPNGTSEESHFWGEQEVNKTDAFIVLAWDADIQNQDFVEFAGRLWSVVGLQITDTHRTAIRGRLESLRELG